MSENNSKILEFFSKYPNKPFEFITVTDINLKEHPNYYNTPMSDEFKQALHGLSLNYSYESARAELWLAMRDIPKYPGLTTDRLQDTLGLYNTEEKTKPYNVYEALQVIKTFKEAESSYGLFSKLGRADELVEEQYGLSIERFSDIEILSVGTFADWYAFNNGDLDYKFVSGQSGYNAEVPTDAKYVIGHSQHYRSSRSY